MFGQQGPVPVVEKPMTPRGVEHTPTAGDWYVIPARVEKPMTPRGVEHFMNGPDRVEPFGWRSR